MIWPIIRKFLIIKDEKKKDLCDWICENATKEDFTNFAQIFEILEQIIIPKKIEGK